MAVVKMSKLRLIGLDYEREKILNSLHKTGLVELKEPEVDDTTFTVADDKLKENLKTKSERIERCIEFISDRLDKARNAPYYPEKLSGTENNIIVSYDEFMSVSERESALFEVIGKTEEMRGVLLDNKAKTVKLTNKTAQLAPFLAVKDKFTDFKDTLNTRCFFGTVQESALTALEEFVSENVLSSLQVFVKGAVSVISLVTYKDFADEAHIKLGELGFSKCPFDEDITPAELSSEINKELRACIDDETNISKQTCALAENLKDLKILADRYKFEEEKTAASEKFRCTEKTFTLEGYFPEEEKEKVIAAVESVSSAVFTEVSAPADDETPPTLLKNNKIAAQAEFVTNMYSAPDYREFDPNGFVFVFFMIFFGLIMADIGYGLVLMLIGFVMRRRIKIENGTKKLMSIIMYGGFFTVIFGALFGSLFGVTLYNFFPNPIVGDSVDRNNVLTLLLGCLALGLIQITFGYLLKAVNEFRRKKYLDGIFDGIVWVCFNVGLFLAVFDFITEFFNIIDTNSTLYAVFKTLQLPGVILALGSLLVAVLTAGRHEKGIGKFTKGFGAVYGIINLLSDVLSYARLFGLMLSGMIISMQFNKMGLNLINGGTFGYVLGPIVMVVGHVFNLGMGVLGAYIHDCRLQYIEFFSKFYTGEGELFTPLGSEFNYIYLTK